MNAIGTHNTDRIRNARTTAKRVSRLMTEHSPAYALATPETEAIKTFAHLVVLGAGRTVVVQAVRA